MLMRVSARWPRFVAPARNTSAPTLRTGTGALSAQPTLAGAGERLSLPVVRVTQQLAPAYGRWGRFTLNSVSPAQAPGSQFGTGALVGRPALAVAVGRGFNDVGADILLVQSSVSGTNTFVTYAGTGVLAAQVTITAQDGIGRRSTSAALSVTATLAGTGIRSAPGSQFGTGTLLASSTLAGVGVRRLTGLGSLVAQSSISAIARTPISGTGSLVASASITGAGTTSQKWRRVTKPASNWQRLTAVA